MTVPTKSPSPTAHVLPTTTKQSTSPTPPRAEQAANYHRHPAKPSPAASAPNATLRGEDDDNGDSNATPNDDDNNSDATDNATDVGGDGMQRACRITVRRPFMHPCRTVEELKSMTTPSTTVFCTAVSVIWTTAHHFDEDDARHKRDGHHDDVSAPRRDPDRNNPDAAAYDPNLDPNPSPDHHATADARWGFYSATPTIIKTWAVKMAGPDGSGDATKLGDGEVTNDLSDRGHDSDDNDNDGRGCEDDDATTTKRRRRPQSQQRRREDEDVTTTTTTGRQRCGDVCSLICISKYVLHNGHYVKAPPVPGRNAPDVLEEDCARGGEGGIIGIKNFIPPSQ
ncbi:hypothetical protein EDB89DRAFT_1906756 [Lactarius sanguifluus]|nr:hypothetical protein EDB89DRAFT_1906756 [Lactarius sanguifluus]